jgi:fibronectin-binding autotransporter adhesin
MKRRRPFSRRSAIIFLFGRVWLGWLLVTFWLITPSPIFGADEEWTGSTSSTWKTSTNWFGGAVPGKPDNAKFDSRFGISGNQPDLTGNAMVGGLWMTTGVGQNVTITANTGFTLTLQGNTINGTVGLGILMDSGTAALTINAPLKLGAAQTWTNNSGNLLTIGAGGVDIKGNVLTINGSGNTTISGVVSDNTGGGTITEAGSGALSLSGANTYSGNTTLSSGTLNINNAGSGGTSSAIGTGAFTINGGTIDNTTSGAITLTTNNAITLGANFTFGGTQNLNLGTGAITNAGNRTITLNGTNSTLTFGGTMTNSSGANQITTVNGAGNTLVLGGYTLSNSGSNRTDTINGSGNVTITGVVASGSTSVSGLTYGGSGVLTLSGPNTYGGVTTVNSGTLLVNGNSSSATGNVSVNNSGTTLGGTGTIGGPVTVGSGAKLLGGTGSAASGTLTLGGGLTLSSGSIIELALGASGAHSTLARTGISGWIFAGNQAFTFINLGAQPGNYYNIITGLASDPNSEANWTITNAGWIGSFSYGSGDISLTVTAVPEPATWIAGAFALGAVGWTQRRRFFRALRRT